MRLSRRSEPFSHTDWLYEIKYDGFRALAYVHEGKAELVSRNGNTFKNFPDLCLAMPASLKVRSAVLDGEIVSLDASGKSQFRDLMFRRGEPRFYAIVPRHGDRLLYCDHVEEDGEALFRLACEHDLEGIVGKRKDAPYDSAQETTWLKIRNRRYSQWIGREELFERERSRTS